MSLSLPSHKPKDAGTHTQPAKPSGPGTFTWASLAGYFVMGHHHQPMLHSCSRYDTEKKTTKTVPKLLDQSIINQLKDFFII
jgi:hypothetical protein